MAETTSGNGDTATNTTTVTSGSTGRTNTGTGNTVSNTTVTTSGTGEGVSSGAPVSPKATEEVKVGEGVVANTYSVPYPHQALSDYDPKTDGVVYKDLVEEEYKRHDKLMKEADGNVFQPTNETLAARRDAQEVLAAELRDNLAAQRMMIRPEGVGAGDIKVKLTDDLVNSGVRHKKGDEIMVDEATATFIEDAKVGKRV